MLALASSFSPLANHQAVHRIDPPNCIVIVPAEDDAQPCVSVGQTKTERVVLRCTFRARKSDKDSTASYHITSFASSPRHAHTSLSIHPIHPSHPSLTNLPLLVSPLRFSHRYLPH